MVVRNELRALDTELLHERRQQFNVLRQSVIIRERDLGVTYRDPRITLADTVAGLRNLGR